MACSKHYTLEEFDQWWMQVDRQPVLFHITTSDTAFAKLKYRQLDIYLPIE